MLGLVFFSFGQEGGSVLMWVSRGVGLGMDGWLGFLRGKELRDDERMNMRES